jgi:WD40 repeat protein
MWTIPTPAELPNAPCLESAAVQGDKIPLQYDKPETVEFNANPLPIPPQNSRSARSASSIKSAVGNKRLFWLDDSERVSAWKEKQATLAAVSNHAEIWIVDEYFDNKSSGADGKLTSVQARAMAEKFRSIYLISPIIYRPYRSQILTLDTFNASLWDISNKQIIQQFFHQGSLPHINAADFSSGGVSLVTGSGNKLIRMWNVDSGKVIKDFPGYRNEATAVIRHKIKGAVRAFEYGERVGVHTLQNARY